VPSNPWMKSLALASHTIRYNLFTLMQAADPTLKYSQCSKLQIQFDKNAQAANLFIGNEDVTPTVYGVSLVATQAFGIEEAGKNIINLEQIWLVSDTDAQTIHVTVGVT